MYHLSYVKVYSTKWVGNLLLLDDVGRVRSHITSVVCQIQRFDFDCNLVVTQKSNNGDTPGFRFKTSIHIYVALEFLSAHYNLTSAQAKPLYYHLSTRVERYRLVTDWHGLGLQLRRRTTAASPRG
jgi:hypothetical protein